MTGDGASPARASGVPQGPGRAKLCRADFAGRAWPSHDPPNADRTGFTSKSGRQPRGCPESVHTCGALPDTLHRIAEALGVELVGDLRRGDARPDSRRGFGKRTCRGASTQKAPPHTLGRRERGEPARLREPFPLFWVGTGLFRVLLGFGLWEGS